MTKTKITLTDSGHDILFKMSEGIPGALTVCLKILKEGEQIDPDNMFGGFGVLLSLDDAGIYGSRIWMLYKDVCGQNLSKMLAVLRGWQLGLVSKERLHAAIENHGVGLNIEEVVAGVAQQLPRFNMVNTSAEAR